MKDLLCNRISYHLDESYVVLLDNNISIDDFNASLYGQGVSYPVFHTSKKQVKILLKSAYIKKTSSAIL